LPGEGYRPNPQEFQGRLGVVTVTGAGQQNRVNMGGMDV
jgi:hypothetical protein